MLTLVGTPIGNLDDMSPRACKALLEADVILAEDTRSVRTLIERAQHFAQNAEYGTANSERIIANREEHLSTSGHSPFPIRHSQKIVSYYQEVEFQKLPEVIEWLKEGLDVVLVSEAGMPIISDPGFLLVQTARKYDIPMTVIPGPSSVDTALVASGLKFDHFHFVGFLPKKTNEKTKLSLRLSQISQIMHGSHIVFVAFESPERVADTLTQLYAEYPTISIVLCRELTKKFEEVVVQPEAKPYKGEIVLLFSFK